MTGTKQLALAAIGICLLAGQVSIVTSACGGHAIIDETWPWPPVGGSGGTGGTGGTGAAAGTGGTENGCGDPAVMARYETCLAADDEASCLAAGGVWEAIGLSPEPVCICPTSQGHCVCDHPSQCLSECIATPVDGVMDCEGIVEGRCAAAAPFVGCWCIFDQRGVPQGLCID